MNIYCSLFFVLTLVTITTSTDVSVKGDLCSQFDSCYSKPKQRTCSCAHDCHVLDTCCHDSNKPISDHSSVPFQCYHQRTITPVFVKRSCVDDYGGHIRAVQACFADIDEMDVKNNLLVTSHKTKTTYWNSYCALCNNEAEEDLELWNIEVFCPPREGVDRWLIRRNLTFDVDKKHWGLDIGGEFLHCIVKYTPPPYIDEVKHCTPNLITSCPADYIKKKIVKKCSEYYAERKLKNSDQYYRNIHCAICNGVDVRDLECSGMRKPMKDVEETDFREMVEEVFTKGQWLDRKDQQFLCSKGYLYDPLWKKCRKFEVPLPIVAENSSETLKLGLLSLLIGLLAFLC